MARQVGRVPSMTVPLDRDQETRFERLMDSITLVDMHEHPMVLTDDAADFGAYFRSKPTSGATKRSDTAAGPPSAPRTG